MKEVSTTIKPALSDRLNLIDIGCLQVAFGWCISL
jgi:hypothetical protein